MSDYLIASEYDPVFKNYTLTELMILRKNGRRNHPQKLEDGIYYLLSELLAMYGITIGGMVKFSTYDVTAITLKSDFDPRNELIIRQLYGFTDGEVNIQLALDVDEEGAFAFDYNVKTYKCVFKKYFLGRTKEEKEFDTLSDILVYIKEREQL